MYDLPPPPSAIVYEIPLDIRQNLGVSYEDIVAIIEYIETSEDWYENLSEEEIRRVEECLCQMAKFGSLFLPKEETETLDSDIQELLNPDPVAYNFNEFSNFQGFEILPATNIFKKTGKAICKGGKKVGRFICRNGKKAGEFIWEHKKAILISAGVATGIAITTYAIVSKNEASKIPDKNIKEEHKNETSEIAKSPPEKIFPDLNVEQDINNSFIEESAKEIPYEKIEAPVEKKYSSDIKETLNYVASGIAHKAWEMQGFLRIEASKTVSEIKNLTETIAPGLSNEPSCIPTLEKVKKQILDGHEKIDQFFSTNLKCEFQEVEKGSIIDQVNKSQAKLELPPPLIEEIANGKNLSEVICKSEKFVKNNAEKIIALEAPAKTGGESGVFKEIVNNLKTTEKLAANSSDMLIEGFSIEKLAEAGRVLDRTDFTKAGRALAKHGGRNNSVFPKPIGTPSQINQQGQAILESILNNPNSKIIKLEDGGLKIFAPDGKGLHYNNEGILKGFVEAQYE